MYNITNKEIHLMGKKFIPDHLMEFSIPEGELPLGVRQVIWDKAARFLTTYSIRNRHSDNTWNGWIYNNIVPDDFEWKWKSGVGDAKLTTRLKRVLQQEGWYLPDQFYSWLGQFCVESMDIPTSAYYELSNDMNWDAGDFMDDDSCFWDDRTCAREYIADHFEFHTLKVYRDKDMNHTVDRAILYAPDDEYIVVYNGYGLSTHQFGTLLSSVVEGVCLPKYIRFTGYASNRMWVNNEGNVYAVVKEQKEIENVPTAIPVSFEGYDLYNEYADDISVCDSCGEVCADLSYHRDTMNYLCDWCYDNE